VKEDPHRMKMIREGAGRGNIASMRPSDPWGDAARLWWLRFTGSFELLDNARRNALRRWLPQRSPNTACCLNGQVGFPADPSPLPRVLAISSLASRGPMGQTSLDSKARWIVRAGLRHHWSQCRRRTRDGAGAG